MNNKYIGKLFLSLSLLFLFASKIYSQEEEKKLSGRVVDDSSEAVISANIYWLGTVIYTTTDLDGAFSINRTDRSNKLVVSCSGYMSDTLDIPLMTGDLSITLHPIMMDDVEVTGYRKGRSKARVSVENREHINTNELIRAACCNLGESFTTNPSVDVSTTDAATGTKQIKLLGLSGKYVQMQTENYPNFRGVSSPFALGYIPGSWIESIQVSKGAASVKNGFESMTGQINIEYKKPNVDRFLEGNIYLDQGLKTELNLLGNYQFGSKKWSTALLTHVEDRSLAHDGNHDSFTDMPLQRQYNVMNRWTYKSDHLIFQSGLSYLHESRRAGQYGHAQKELVNPYTIGITTHRGEAFAKIAHIINHENGTNMALILNATKLQHNANYGFKTFGVGQSNLYASLLFESQLVEHHSISSGLSWQYDHYDNSVQLQQKVDVAPIKSRYAESVPGAYVQYTYTPIHELVIMGGVRADYSSLHGFFVTPRFHLRYNPSSVVSLQLSAGKGYRTHGVLTENNHLLASGRTMVIHPGAENLQEESWNYGASIGFDIPVFEEKILELNAEYYFTNFINRLVVDMDRNAHELHFYALNGKSYSHTLQVDASYNLFRGFDLTAAFRYTDVKNTIDEALVAEPLTSRYKGLLTASYKTPLRLWQADVTLSLNGGGRMPKPYMDGEVLSWKPTYGAYPLLSAQITRFFPKWSIYLGGENLTNFKQPNPIISAQDPWTKKFDSTMVWGPTEGMMLYLGVRFNLFDN